MCQQFSEAPAGGALLAWNLAARPRLFTNLREHPKRPRSRLHALFEPETSGTGAGVPWVASNLSIGPKLLVPEPLVQALCCLWADRCARRASYLPSLPGWDLAVALLLLGLAAVCCSSDPKSGKFIAHLFQGLCVRKSWPRDF